MPFVDVWTNLRCFVRTTNKAEKLVFEYEEGKLYALSKKQKQEIMYVHFQKRSMKVKTLNQKHYKIQPEEFVDVAECTKYSIRVPSIWLIKHGIKKIIKR